MGRCFSGRAFALDLAVVVFFATVFPSFGVIRDGGVDPSNLGQGGWLYIMQDATNHLGGNVSSVTNENSLFAYMKSVGYNYVIVKAATSNTLWNGNYSTAQFTSNLVKAAHSNGLFIFGSNRSWGNDNPGEIAIANYIFNTGADGYIWDAEAEWETSSSNPWITNGPAQAWQLCSTIRSNWPTKFLAYNPFDTISLHSTFPYKEFGYWSDSVMPQVYHHSASQGNAIAAIEWMDVEYSTFQKSLSSIPNTNINGLTVVWTNSIKPVTLMREVYGTNYSSPYPDKDVRNFLDYIVADPNCVTVGGYQGSDYFRSELHDGVQWGYMQAATIGKFSNIVNNIVIDDPNASRSGTWTNVKTISATTSTVTFSGTIAGDTNSFGTNYLVKGKGTGSAFVQFTPNILTEGIYDVYHWHPTRPDASATVPFVVICATGTNTVTANQQTNGGDWSFLGQFKFNAGTGGNIRVTDGFSESGDVAMADGVKLIYVPTPTISLAGNAAAGNVSLVFSPYQPDRVYQVQTATSLRSNAVWTTLNNLTVVSSNGIGTITIPHQSGTTEYFRMTVRLPQ